MLRRLRTLLSRSLKIGEVARSPGRPVNSEWRQVVERSIMQ
ncbi:Arc family DNA-binding protein [Caballeronia sp.]